MSPEQLEAAKKVEITPEEAEKRRQFKNAWLGLKGCIMALAEKQREARLSKRPKSPYIAAEITVAHRLQHQIRGKSLRRTVDVRCACRTCVVGTMEICIHEWPPIGALRDHAIKVQGTMIQAFGLAQFLS